MRTGRVYFIFLILKDKDAPMSDERKLWRCVGFASLVWTVEMEKEEREV